MSSNYKQGRIPTYDPSFKIAVAREYLTSTLGYGAMAKKYGLPGPVTVRFFVHWYKKRYPDGQVDQSIDNGQTKTLQPLSKELQQANLKIAGLETLIEVAQKELGIDIVKKFGAKQSKK